MILDFLTLMYLKWAIGCIHGVETINSIQFLILDQMNLDFLILEQMILDEMIWTPLGGPHSVHNIESWIRDE